MELTKQGGAASSKPAGDLDTRLHAMRLGDPSPSRKQARNPPPTQLLLPSPPQVRAPTATPDVQPPLHQPQPQPRVVVPTATPVERPPPVKPPQPKRQELAPTESLDVRLLRQLQVVRQSQPKLLRGGGDESPPADGCVTPVGGSSSSRVFASLYGKHSPRFNAPVAPFLPVAPKPNMLSASAEAFRPIAQSHPSMAQSSSTPSSSASQCPPHLGAAAASSALHDNASLDPYASALLSASRTNQADSPWRGRAPAIGHPPSLDEVQARLLYAPMKPANVKAAGSSERVVHLLAERGEEARLRVLAVVKRAVHRIMGCKQGHVVFLALLRACEGRFNELQDIVRAACNAEGGSLMRIVKEEHGEKALKELIRVVAPYPQLSQPLIVCLLRERLMEHCKGAQLLQHCFTTLPYKDSSSIIRYAIATIGEMLSSAAASRCLAECFVNARNDELRALENVILSNTSVLAKGEYSNYFLQRVLEHGSKQLKEGIAERVSDVIVDLSKHQFGSYVVEACILLTCSFVPLLRLLNAFQRLYDDQLAELVQGGYSNYIVQKLLTTGKAHFPEQTMALARRIKELPAPVLKNMHAGQVMKVAKKLFPKQL